MCLDIVEMRNPLTVGQIYTVRLQMIDIALVSDEPGMYFNDYLKSCTENLYGMALAH